MRNLSIILKQILLLASLCALPIAALADEIRMKNGDVLTGTIIKKETDKLILRTVYAGEISINWTEVATIESENSVKIMLTDNAHYHGRIHSSTEDGKVFISEENVAETQVMQTEVTEDEEEEIAEEREIRLNDLLYINPSPVVSGLGRVWNGHVNLGGTMTEGNTKTQAFNLDTEAVMRSKYNRFTIGAIVFRAESEDVDTKFNSRGSMKYDHFVSKKWYLYANSVLENDRFKDIKLRSSVGAGSGYQIFEQPNMNLYIEGGLNYINTDYYVAESENYPALRWSTKYDQLVFGGNTKFFHEHEILAALESASDILVFSKTGLRVPLSERLHASTQYNYDWSQSPAPGREKADSALIFSLGYGW